MAQVKPRVKVPKTAAVGEVITVKTLISHKMETGTRKDSDGNTIPRNIINRFVCRFNGAEVFSADLEPAVSANPYFEFSLRVPESGTLDFEWTEDTGEVYTKSAEITAT